MARMFRGDAANLRRNDKPCDSVPIWTREDNEARWIDAGVFGACNPPASFCRCSSSSLRSFSRSAFVSFPFALGDAGCGGNKEQITVSHQYQNTRETEGGTLDAKQENLFFFWNFSSDGSLIIPALRLWATKSCSSFGKQNQQNLDASYFLPVFIHIFHSSREQMSKIFVCSKMWQCTTTRNSTTISLEVNAFVREWTFGCWTGVGMVCQHSGPCMTSEWHCSETSQQRGGRSLGKMTRTLEEQ